MIVDGDGERAFRPLQAGGFLIAWDERGANVPTRSTPITELMERLNAPEEYLGLIATNAETTLSVWAFLIRYRCLRYNVGCRGVAAGPPAGAQPDTQTAFVIDGRLPASDSADPAPGPAQESRPGLPAYAQVGP